MMESKSIRTFIGAPNFLLCCQFYRDMEFEEVPLGNMSYFRITDKLGFYLQDYYVKDWVNNSMIFLEVNNVEEALKDINQRT